jgi:hypothetical protein
MNGRIDVNAGPRSRTRGRAAMLGAAAAGALRLGVAILALAAAIAVGPALAIDGDDMVRDCIGALAVERAACLGYVTAVMDVLRLDPVRGFEACVPREVRPEEAVAVVADYVRRNPGAGGFQAPPVIAAALAEAFPCSR